MLSYKRSQNTIKKTPHIQPIILVYQFFIHSNKQRNNEIKQCLKFNIANRNISKIILPNERIFTHEELGIKSDKIIQVDIKRRLKFSDIFELVDKMKLTGYIITCNADIFFNNTLTNIYSSGIHKEKILYAQLRFEYTNRNLLKCKLFGPRCDSQDVWIFHSKFNISEDKRKLFNFKYGIGGCDNKVAFLFDLLGYNVKNDPFLIKCFHNHNTQIRDYMGKPTIPTPHMAVVPYLNPRQDTEQSPWNSLTKQSGIDFDTYSAKETSFTNGMDMNSFIRIIKNATTVNKSFVVPLVSVHGANIVHLFKEFYKEGENKNEYRQKIHISNMQSSLKALNREGLALDDIQKIQLFSVKYMDLIYKAGASLHYSPGDLEFYSLSRQNNPCNISPNIGPIIHRGLMDIARKANRAVIHNAVLNIGHYINKELWCDHIHDKKILIISKHHALIENQINKKVNFYGRPLFKNCTFTYASIPERNEKNDFVSTINNYVSVLGSKLNNFDMAFVGETPYSFFILDYLLTSNKSAISAGKYLKNWFGLYTFDTLKKSRDIIALYMNGDWVKITEKKNVDKIQLFWQYPVITEKTFYEQNKNNSDYLGLPWATIIDKKISLDQVYNLITNNQTKHNFTCCQHVHFRKLIHFWRSIGIKTVYSPHKKIGEDQIDGIKILPCPLFAVNVEDKTRNNLILETDILECNRPLLYSFSGGYQSHNYLTDIREKIFNLKSRSKEDVYIRNTGTWHFNCVVYNDKQNDSGELNESNEHKDKTRVYNELLLKSKFTLCPSGSGPNSIRFWEALGAGSIPVLLADTLDLPNNKLWSSGILRVKESDIHRIDEILRSITPVEIKNRQKHCLTIYNQYKDNYRGLQLEESATNVPGFWYSGEIVKKGEEFAC